MLHSIEVFLPVVQVVLEGPVTVVTEVPFPHLSLGKTASACPGITRQLLGAQPWEWKIQDLQRLLPKEENSNHLGLAARERGETQQFISLSITDCWGRICCLCMGEKAWICIYLCHPKQQQLCLEGSSFPEFRPHETESQRLQGRCSTNHPRCKQEELEVLGTFDHNLHELTQKQKETPWCPSLQGEEETQQSNLFYPQK